jgi:amidohydrolase
VVLVFQPAEEVLGGAQAMIEDGAAEGLDMALGFHNSPDMPVGRFGYTRGATLAAADRFDLVVKGKSGHAAHPQHAIDPVVAAAAFVTQAQTVVSREIDPHHPAVVTIGMFHGGSAPNIIPESVELKGTVRTLHNPARDTAEAALKRLAEGLATMHRVNCELSYRRGVPPLVNDDRVLEPAVAAVRAQFGEVVEEGRPSMGAEDFSEFAERVPSFQLRIGAGAPGRSDRLHNTKYQPDERCIGLGVQALARAALELLA